MPTSITVTQLELLEQEFLNGTRAGDLTFYAQLAALGYGYPSLATGVVTNSGISGIPALQYLESYAQSQGITLDADQLVKIENGLASGYAQALLNSKNGSGVISSDITFDQALVFHTAVFSQFGLNPDAWTLYEPYEVLGEQTMQSDWQSILNMAGSSVEGVGPDMQIMYQMGQAALFASSAATKQLALSWLESMTVAFGDGYLGKAAQAVVALVNSVESGLSSAESSAQSWLGSVESWFSSVASSGSVEPEAAVILQNANGTTTYSIDNTKTGSVVASVTTGSVVDSLSLGPPAGSGTGAQDDITLPASASSGSQGTGAAGADTGVIYCNQISSGSVYLTTAGDSQVELGQAQLSSTGPNSWTDGTFNYKFVSGDVGSPDGVIPTDGEPNGVANEASPWIGELQVMPVSGSGESLDLVGFDMSQALQDGGFLGISFSQGVTLGCGTSTEPSSLAPPTFMVGDMQSYTVYLNAPLDISESIIVTLAGVSASDFAVNTGSGFSSLNSDGTFAVIIPAGQDSAVFSLANTADVGGNATMTLSATLGSDQNSGNDSDSSPQITQNFVESSDLFSTDQQSVSLVGGAETATGSAGSLAVNYYTNPAPDSVADPSDLLTVGSGNNYINVVGVPNVSVSGGLGNDTINADFGHGLSNAGVNVIAGDSGQDFITSDQYPADGTSNVQIYADSPVSISQAIEDANLQTGTGQQGDFIDATNNESTIVGGTGNDLLVDDGQSSGLIVAGSGDDTILGGAQLGFLTDTGYELPGADGAYVGQTWSATFADNQLELGGDLLYLGPTEWTVNGAGESVPGSTVPALLANYEGNVDAYGGALGDGNDTIYGGAGNDVIILSNGDNEVDPGVGDTTVLGGMGDNTVTGGDGNDSIVMGGGSDYVEVGDGNDVVVGQGGDNTIFGGAGQDSLLAGASGSEWATYETGNNYVEAGSGNTVIWGSGGDDTLIGGPGNDTIYAGDGNEYVDGDSGNATIYGGAGSDTIDAGDGSTTSVTVGTGDTTVYGGSGNDQIWGGSGSNVLYAGDGGTSDTPTQVVAGDGDTTIYGGSGFDLLVGGSGNDVIYAGDYGGDASDIPLTTEVSVGSGNTTVYGGLGTDSIFGGSGTDVLYAGDGGIDSNPTWIVAGTGTATLTGGAGADVLQDSLSGADLLIAGGGDAALEGIGSDTLVAGIGYDSLSGSGDITYVVGADAGSVEINNTGGNGTIQLDPSLTVDDISLIPTTGGDGSQALEIDAGDASITVDGALTDPGAYSVSFGGSSPESLSDFIQQVAADGGVSDNYAQGANGNSITSIANGDSVDGGVGQDTITAYGSGDTLTAGSGGSIINAFGSQDAVYGGTGPDTLSASGAQTTLYGGTGQETYVVNDPTDVIVATPGATGGAVLSSVSYTLPTNVDQLTLTGSADLTAYGNADAANLITGNSGNDTLYAESGTDMLVSGSGVDVLVAGGDEDTFVINNSSDQIQLPWGDSGNLDTVESAVSYTVAAPIGNLTLIGSSDISATAGTSSNVVITGNIGDDTLTGGAGQDTLVAGSGIDTLVAGSGSTTFVIDNADDVISGLNSSQVNQVESSVNYVLPQYVDAVTLEGGADLQAQGSNDASNYILGNSGNDTLIAGGGSDTLVGGIGLDTLVAGSGTDLLQGGNGDTFEFNSGFGSTEVSVTSGAGVVQFGAGIDPGSLTLSVAEGADGDVALVIQDGTGSITVDDALDGSISSFDFANGQQLTLSQLLQAASASDATVAGATGNIVLNADAGASLTGGVGGDTLIGAGDGDTLTAGAGSQVLFGAGTDDVLFGGTGSDTLIGGNGPDTLVAGSGTTELQGGSGWNTYALTQGGTATISATGASGLQTVVLPEGMTLADFAPALDSQGNLVISALSGGTTAVVEGYQTLGQAAGWIIEDQSGDAESLSAWASQASQAPPEGSSYAANMAWLLQIYNADEPTVLSKMAATGGTLQDPTSPQDSNSYQGGVSVDAIPVQDGYLGLSASESDNSVHTQTGTQTISEQVDVYGNYTVPGYSYFVPDSSDSGWNNIMDELENPLDSADDPHDTITAVYQDSTFTGYEITTPSQTEYGKIGTTTETYTVPQYYVSRTNSITFYEVVGDGENDTIEDTGGGTSYDQQVVGSVETGNGNVLVDLGLSRYDEGDSSGESGSFIEAGAGNDTILGSGFEDTIAAGTGFDFLDGAQGTTYYAPMAAGAVDVIGDYAPEYGDWNGQNAPVPQSTLVLPEGVTAADLQYRLYQIPYGTYSSILPGPWDESSYSIPAEQNVLELTYGDSSVLLLLPSSSLDSQYLEDPGVTQVQYANGTILTLSQLMAQATELPNDNSPLVTAQNQTVTAGQVVAANSLFQSTSASDDQIGWYQIANSGSGGGYFILNGQEQPVGQTFYVASDQLSGLDYVAGSGGQDEITVTAFDGAVWSAAQEFNIAVSGSQPTSTTTTTYNSDGSYVVTIVDTSTTGAVTTTVSDYGAQGQEQSQQLTNPDGSTDATTWNYNSDGSYSTSELDISAVGIQSTTTSNYESDGTLISSATANAQGQETSALIKNSDGSSDADTWSYNSYGGYSLTDINTLSGGEVATTTVTNYSEEGQPQTAQASHLDGSTDTVVWDYNSDGSYETQDYNVSASGAEIVTMNYYNASGSLTETVVRNAQAELLSEQYYDSDGGSDSYAWSYNADGSYTVSEVYTPTTDSTTQATSISNYNAQGQEVSEQETYLDGGGDNYGWSYNADGSYTVTDIYAAAPGDFGSGTYLSNFNAEGQEVSELDSYTSGGSDAYAWNYNSDGSYVLTDVYTTSSGTVTTTVGDFNAQGQEQSAQQANPDGSVYAGTWNYNADGSFIVNGVTTSTSGATISTDIATYSTTGQEQNDLITNSGGSTDAKTWSYNSDGSYSVTEVTTPTGGGTPTTVVYNYNAQGQLIDGSGDSNMFAASGADQTVTGSLSGPSTLTGGYSGDVLVGQSGQDTFVYQAGSGAESVSETVAASSAGDDVLEFGAGITAPEITGGITQDGQLMLSIGSGGDSVAIDGFNPINPVGSLEIQGFQFSDGTASDFVQLLSSMSTSSGSVTNADGSVTNYSFGLSGTELYNEATTAANGSLINDYVINSDGSTDYATAAYNADGSYSTAEQITSASDVETTTTSSYGSDGSLISTETDNAQGQEISAQVNNPDGSSDVETWVYNGDGSYTETDVYTAPSSYISGSNEEESGTYTSNYNAQGQEVSELDTYTAGGSDAETWAYNADGSYTITDVYTTPAGYMPPPSGENQAGTYVENYNAEGQEVSELDTYTAGGSDALTWSYNTDGSYAIADVCTFPSDSPYAGLTGTYLESYNAQGQAVSEQITYTEGSSSSWTWGSESDTWSYNADGSYTVTGIYSPPYGYGGAGTYVDDYNAQGQEISEQDTYTDGSTYSGAFTYNADGSSVENATNYESDGTVYDTVETVYDPQGNEFSTCALIPGSSGNYTGDWSDQDGSSGVYWWNNGTGQYQENWTDASGATFTDEYEYGAGTGNNPTDSGVSYTETFEDSAGDSGSRQYNAATGITTVTWDSASTGQLSGTTTNSAFLGLQGADPMEGYQPDLTFFNPAVSSAFQQFLSAH